MKKISILLSLGLIVLLAACSPDANNAAVTKVAPVLEDSLPPDAALNIQNEVSQLLGVAVERLQLVSVDKTEWPDGCLGLPKPDEVCTQALVEGWTVVFSVDGTQYTFRSDESGVNIRQEP